MADGSLASPITAPAVLLVQLFVKGLPALTAGGVLFTVTVTEAVAVQPVAVIVLVTVYVVVTEGFAVGLLAAALLKSVAGFQEYVAPASAVSPICPPAVFDVHVFVKGLPALTVVPALFTVTVTDAVFEQPAIVFVTVYVVVTEGFAIGLLADGLLKSVTGSQE